MVVLDTNVMSALMHEPPQSAVIAWLDRQPRISIWTTAITLMELRYGIEVLAPGRRRIRLFQALERLIAEKIEHRVAAFDEVAANATAVLMAERRRAGLAGDLRDTMIAGIAIANHATVVTRNVRHFADLSVPVVDPWNA
jgi:toxin FitB